MGHGIIARGIVARGAGAMLAAAAVAAPASASASRETIGVATQEADGTIVLMLRTRGAGGAGGDAQVRYTPADKDYAMIARHVGPIPPGGSVPVKPFPAK